MIGAIIGDIVGSGYEFCNMKTKDVDLFYKNATFTDDTVMTIAVLDVLLKHKEPTEEEVTKTLRKWGRKYRYSGYGGRFAQWLDCDNPKPYGSYGNGAVMRISPVGWIANSEEEVKKLSHAVTAITHNHPEALKAAEVVAMCIYYARIGKSKNFIRAYIEKNYDIDFDYDDLVRNYSFNETCQESVPQALYCFVISNSFEDCLRTTISIGGDCDTTAAMSCAIAEAYYQGEEGISDELFDYAISKLPKDMRDVLAEFDKRELEGKEIADEL